MLRHHARHVCLVFALALTAACRDPNSPAARQDFREAIQQAQTTTVERWLDHGLDPNEEPTEACSTPLALAVIHGNSDIVRLLIEHGANVNAPASPNGSPVLHCAADLEQDAPELLDLLLQSGAEVNAVSEDRITPLMLAAQRGHAESVQVLLAAQPDLEIRSTGGKTAIEIAAAAKRTEVVSLLRRAGARLTLPPPSEQEDATGQTGLISIATENGMIMLGETFEDAKSKLETGTRIDLKQVSPTRSVEIRRFNNQTYRLTYERDGKTGPFRLVRIELQ